MSLLFKAAMAPIVGMIDPFDGRSEMTAEDYLAWQAAGSPTALILPAPVKTAPDWTTNEKAFMARVVKYATEQGWDVPYHTHNSASSQPGFPDLVFKRDGRVQLVAELKVGENKATKDQRDWLSAFERSGIPAYILRPEQWAFIEELLAA